MGQSASKGLSKAAQKVGTTTTPSAASSQLKRPPIPSRAPSTPEATPENPASFLRGEGIASQDIRDQGQQMYLRHAQQQRQQQHQQERQQQASPSALAAAPTNNNNNMDMPEDLLKFIQDVGPAKQTVDREFTSTRLLKDENKDELAKMESVRTAKRERVRMPLMQGNDSFTTEKNTHFSVSELPAADEYDFGLSNLQIYDLLTRNDLAIKDFRKEILAEMDEEEESSKAETETALLSQTLDAIEVPTLRMNPDGDILGLYAREVPGPEMSSIKEIPETKAILVLKDLIVNGVGNQAKKAGEKKTIRKLEE